MKFTTAKAILSATALVFVTFMAAPAKATPVSFYTEASIDGGTESANPLVNFITFDSGAVTLSFTGITSSVSVPSFTSFGSISTAGTTSGGGTLPTDTPFTLDIFQTAPGTGSATLAAVLNGSISLTSSSATITFATTSTTIDGVNYSIANNPLALVPLTGGGGSTTIQGYVNATPEPVTTALVGVGLLGVGLLRRRKA